MSHLNAIDFQHGKVELKHGGGGRASAQLIAQLFMRHFDNPQLRLQNDQAIFTPPAGRLVMSTDGHVVSPLFFPGGDIGALAVHGTLNDVAMAGAQPLYLSAGFILEEGLPLSDLQRIVISMAQAASQAGVHIVTGDTKVVERGKADGVFITTTGIGVVADNLNISAERAEAGCAILLSGSIGDHGMAIMAERSDLPFRSQIQSDSAALHTLVAAMLQAAGPAIHCLRDPTRGGLASTLNELAQQAKTGMRIDESQIPVKPAVRAACEILGIDPLHVANEGKLVCICAANAAETLLRAMRQHPLGREAAIIGEVRADPHHFVEMQTVFGGRRIVDWLSGDPLPRIC
jgi:hydrogenase expression/formation protein HypE